MNLWQDKKDIFDLIKWAYKWEIMLPDFQRPFVWNREDIEALLTSLIENSFIWIFLLCEVDPINPIFKTIAVDWANEVNNAYREYPKTIVLDWQQRLTSLFYAVYWPNKPLTGYSYPYKFFINIKNLINQNNDDYEEESTVIFSLSNNSSKYKSLLKKDWSYNIDILKEKWFFPISFLKDWWFSDIWYENDKWWLDIWEAKIIKEKIEQIIKYQIYTISIWINEDIDEIAKLFERINNTGVKLSTFDLLTARLYKFINLRECREDSYTNNHYIAKFSGSEIRDSKIAYYIIQAIVLARWYKSIKAKEILKVTDNDINPEIWNRVIIVLEQFLTKFFQVNEYWIIEERNIAYKSMIVVILALLINDSNTFDKEKVNKWYWSSILIERYWWSTDSKLYSDYQNLKKWIEKWDEMKIIDDAQKLLKYNWLSLREKSYSWWAIYKAVFNLLLMNCPYDFYHKDDINFTSIDDHHIFPVKFLERKWINNAKEINTILNKTLILSDTNRRKISDKSPHDYLNDMLKIRWGKEKTLEILEKHFINEEMFDLLYNSSEKSSNNEINENFNKFLDLREELITNQFKKILGITYEKVSQEKMIQPGNHYWNELLYKDTISQCKDYIYIIDNYFNASWIKYLYEWINTESVKEILILSWPLRIDERSREDFKKFKKEFKEKHNIQCERRSMLKDSIVENHDRYFISKQSYLIPSSDTVKRGQNSHIVPISIIPDFNTYWNNSLDIIQDWNKIKEFQDNKN